MGLCQAAIHQKKPVQLRHVSVQHLLSDYGPCVVATAHPSTPVPAPHPDAPACQWHPPGSHVWPYAHGGSGSASAMTHYPHTDGSLARSTLTHALPTAHLPAAAILQRTQPTPHARQSCQLKRCCNAHTTVTAASQRLTYYAFPYVITLLVEYTVQPALSSQRLYIPNNITPQVSGDYGVEPTCSTRLVPLRRNRTRYSSARDANAVQRTRYAISYTSARVLFAR